MLRFLRWLRYRRAIYTATSEHLECGYRLTPGVAAGIRDWARNYAGIGSPIADYRTMQPRGPIQVEVTRLSPDSRVAFPAALAAGLAAAGFAATRLSVSDLPAGDLPASDLSATGVAESAAPAIGDQTP